MALVEHMLTLTHPEEIRTSKVNYQKGIPQNIRQENARFVKDSKKMHNL